MMKLLRVIFLGSKRFLKGIKYLRKRQLDDEWWTAQHEIKKRNKSRKKNILEVELIKKVKWSVSENWQSHVFLISREYFNFYASIDLQYTEPVNL